MRVGVTGHRDVDRLGAVGPKVDDALGRLARLASDADPLVVVSSIAEGADRLVASSALARGWDLAVVLPLARAEYREDFATAESLAEFDDLLARALDVSEVPDQPTRDDAYLAAGHAVVDASDVVLALWDGQPARGRGGTAEVVDYTRVLGRPLVWIDVSRPEPVVHVESLVLPAAG